MLRKDMHIYTASIGLISLGILCIVEFLINK